MGRHGGGGGGFHSSSHSSFHSSSSHHHHYGGHGGGGGGSGNFFATFVFLVIGAIVAAIIVIPVTMYSSYKCTNVAIMTGAEQAVCTATSKFGKVLVTQAPLMSGVSSFLFSARPPALDNMTITKHNYSTSLSGRYYEYYSFVLPEGSRVSYNISAPNVVRVLVMDSSNFNKYDNDNSYDTIDYHGDSLSITGSFTASKDDEFFVVTYNPAWTTSTTAKWAVTVEHVQLDLSRPLETCTESSCTWEVVPGNVVITSVSSSISGDIFVKQKYKLKSGIADVVTGVVLGSIGLLILAVAIFALIASGACSKFMKKLSFSSSSSSASSSPATLPTTITAPPQVVVPISEVAPFSVVPTTSVTATPGSEPPPTYSAATGTDAPVVNPGIVYGVPGAYEPSAPVPPTTPQ